MKTIKEKKLLYTLNKRYSCTSTKCTIIHHQKGTILHHHGLGTIVQ